MTTVEMLKPNEKAMRAELEKYKTRLAARPTFWPCLETIGRILRWQGDPEAVSHFQKAIANYPLREDDAGDHVHLGNLYRLAGDQEGARRHFRRARDLYAERVYGENVDRDPESMYPLNICQMIIPSFLIGNDEEVVDLIARLRAVWKRETRLLAYPIAKLAEARRSRNADLAAEAVNDIVHMIRVGRAKLWDTGSGTPWDWYEIGLGVWRELSGEGQGG